MLSRWLSCIARRTQRLGPFQAAKDSLNFFVEVGIGAEIHQCQQAPNFDQRPASNIDQALRANFGS